jgi:hypothetical protein
LETAHGLPIVGVVELVRELVPAPKLIFRRDQAAARRWGGGEGGREGERAGEQGGKGGILTTVLCWPGIFTNTNSSLPPTLPPSLRTDGGSCEEREGEGGALTEEEKELRREGFHLRGGRRGGGEGGREEGREEGRKVEMRERGASRRKEGKTQGDGRRGGGREGGKEGGREGGREEGMNPTLLLCPPRAYHKFKSTFPPFCWASTSNLISS